MYIIFNPALSETNHIPIDDDSPALLNFTATLSVADYHELKRNGGRVQLWSDIPFDGAPEFYNEWTSCDFELNATAGGIDFSAPDISLLGFVDNDDLPSPETVVLTLQLFVPQSDNNNQKRFSYTYRIQYPSGELRWLGEFRQNGTLVCERTTPETALGLAAGWTRKAGIYMWTDSINRMDNPVLRLARPDDYLVWALGDGNGEFLVVLTARRNSRPLSMPPEYILCASPTSVMRIRAEKTITVTGEASLVMSPIPPQRSGLLQLKELILQHCIPERVTINLIGEECLLVATRDTLPVQGIAITTPDIPHPTPLSIPTNTFHSLLPSQTTSTSFFLFSPHTSRAHLVTNVNEITFTNPGPFVLSPAFNITSRVHISILSPYRSAQAIDITACNLPTPPPSPEMMPRLIMPGHHSSSQLSEIASSTPVESVALQPADNKADGSDARNSGDANDGIVQPLRRRQLRALALQMKCLLSMTLPVIMPVLKLIFERFNFEPKQQRSAEHMEDVMTFANDVQSGALDQTNDNDSDETGCSDARTHAGIVPSLDNTSNIDAPRPDELELDIPNSKVLLVEIGGGGVVKLAVWEGVTHGVVNAEMNGKRVLVSRTNGSAQALAGTRVEFWELVVDAGGVLRISYDRDKTACGKNFV